MQSLHLRQAGLLAYKRFTSDHLETALGAADLDGEHWILLYEAKYHFGLTKRQSGRIPPHAVFDDLAANGIRFYRDALPPYAPLITSGGAPDWLVRKLLAPPTPPVSPPPTTPPLTPPPPDSANTNSAISALLKVIREDFANSSRERSSHRLQAIAQLLASRTQPSPELVKLEEEPDDEPDEDLRIDEGDDDDDEGDYSRYG